MRAETAGVVETDILIVGSGLAGLATAFYLLKHSRSFIVTITSKSAPGFGSSTFYSQGAFRCPVHGYEAEEFVRDTLEVGRYINRRWMVKLLADNAVDSILHLREVGLRFKEEKATLRIVSPYKIYPAKEMVLKLVRYLEGSGVKFLSNTRLLDLVKTPTGVWLALHETDDKPLVVVAKAIVLATGGAANVYSRSDNPGQLTCDGHGIALRLGLPLVDMEFIQFYPIGLSEEGKPGFPLTFRQGRILNCEGKDIIAKYGLGSLHEALEKHRDKLSRYMLGEVKVCKESGEFLLLDPLEAEDEESLSARELIKVLGLKPSVKVFPVAHFTMGGVEVEKGLGTRLPGLYVVGELMGGVHGANRVENNALTSCVVFSRIIAGNIAEYIERGFDKRSKIYEQEMLRELIGRHKVGFCSSEARTASSELSGRVKKIMWNNVGVVRSEESLERALSELSSILERLDNISIVTISDFGRLREVENMVLTSLAIVYSAYERKESRGSHFREDFPEEKSTWIRSLRVRYRCGDRFIIEDTDL